MRLSARRAAWGVAVVVLVLGIAFALRVGDDPAAHRPTQLGRVAPAIDAPTLAGDRVTTASLAGRSVLVNFWNSWCIPCRQELPALAEFHRRHGDDPDVVMVGVVRDDTEGAVRDYVRAEGIDWTVALDPDGRAALDWGTTGQPETYMVAPDGRVVGLQLGPVGVDDLEAMLARARGQA